MVSLGEHALVSVVKVVYNRRSLSDLVNVTMLKWLTPVVPPVVVWLC